MTPKTTDDKRWRVGLWTFVVVGVALVVGLLSIDRAAAPAAAVIVIFMYAVATIAFVLLSSQRSIAKEGAAIGQALLTRPDAYCAVILSPKGSGLRYRGVVILAPDGLTWTPGQRAHRHHLMPVHASPEEIVDIAVKQGVTLGNYRRLIVRGTHGPILSGTFVTRGGPDFLRQLRVHHDDLIKATDRRHARND
jgi:hypothetical protein